MSMRATGLSASFALVVLLLVACDTEAEDGGSQPATTPPSPVAEAPPPANPGFGGVIEVTFSTDDAAVQDAAAGNCGLPEGRAAGLAAAPLPPSVRWYPEPADADAAIECMRRQEQVLQVLRPL